MQGHARSWEGGWSLPCANHAHAQCKQALNIMTLGVLSISVSHACMHSYSNYFSSVQNSLYESINPGVILHTLSLYAVCRVSTMVVCT